MALPAIMRRLFAGDGYGPLLKDDVVSKYISIQDWSGSFDYQTATAVRGSDGKLYWSVAASGPNSGGAANPVNDDGSHWVSLPSMADIAAMNYATQSWVGGQGFATQAWVGSQNYATQSWIGNQGYATQAWVGNQGYATQAWVSGKVDPAPVYVDPQNGSDSNDGLSQATAVQHISQALILADKRLGSAHAIYLAGGTYAENVSVQVGDTVIFYLSGSVSISGTIYINNSNVFIGDSSYSLTVTPTSNTTALTVDNRSMFVCGAPLVLNGYGANVYTDPGSNHCLLIANSSYCAFRKEVSLVLYSGKLYSGLNVANHSYALFENTIYIIGTTSATNGIVVNDSSACYFFTVSTSGDIALSNGIYVESQSFAAVAGNATWRGSLTAVAVSSGSELTLNGTNWVYSGADGVCVKSEGLSLISIGGSLNINGTDLQFALMCVNCSIISIFNPDKVLSFTGSAKAGGATIKVSVSSFVFLNNQISITGTFSSPYKYTVGECSMLASNGIASSIPGTDTDLDASTYGVMN